MEIINLDMVPGKKSPVCHASQYDDGRVIRFNLYDSGLPYTLDGTETITFEVRKPDGNIVTSTLTNTSDSYVDVVTTEQMTAVKGANLCEVRVEKGATNIGSLNVIMAVEMDPTDGGIASASEIDNLRSQISGMVAEEVAEQYDSANVIFDAVPTPGHGNGYAVTSEGVNNALAPKANRSELPDMSNYYTKSETDTALDDKVNTTDFDATNLPITSGSATNTKDYIDSKFTYSTTEIVIGKWIDNRPIYEKTISLGQLPNNSQTQIAHNITDLARIISFEGGAYDGNTGTNIPLPYTGTNFVAIAVITSNVFITTNSDRSSLVGYLTLRYVKSTD